MEILQPSPESFIIESNPIVDSFSDARSLRKSYSVPPGKEDSRAPVPSESDDVHRILQTRSSFESRWPGDRCFRARERGERRGILRWHAATSFEQRAGTDRGTGSVKRGGASRPRGGRGLQRGRATSGATGGRLSAQRASSTGRTSSTR